MVLGSKQEWVANTNRVFSRQAVNQLMKIDKTVGF